MSWAESEARAPATTSGTSTCTASPPVGTPTVYASGLTMIGSIAFDQAGRLLVMEIDTAGILDPAT